MKIIDIYYAGDEDCVPWDAEDLKDYMDNDTPSRSFHYTKDLEDTLTRYLDEPIEGTSNAYVLYPKDVLLIIEYCAKCLRTKKSLDDEVTPLTKKQLNACIMLLQFFGSECVLEVSSYYFVIKDNKK